MAVSTTQSIWRSGGGDTTRTAYCGSGLMVATGYVADASVATPADILVSPNGPPLILPENAIITIFSTVSLSGTAGAVDIGITLLSTGTNTPNYIISNFTINNPNTAALGQGSINYAPIPSLAKLTVVDSSSGAGSFTVFFQYFVRDVLLGQQSA